LAAAVVQALFALEVLLSGRQHLRDGLQAMLEGRAWYDERYERLWPYLVLGAVLAALAVAATSLFAYAGRHFGRAGRCVIAGTAITGIMLAVPVVSLTPVDRILYFETGPVLLIAWIWIAGAACTATGAISAARPSAQ
jgi:hypothetical protein